MWCMLEVQGMFGIGVLEWLVFQLLFSQILFHHQHWWQSLVPHNPLLWSSSRMLSPEYAPSTKQLAKGTMKDDITTWQALRVWWKKRSNEVEMAESICVNEWARWGHRSNMNVRLGFTCKRAHRFTPPLKLGSCFVFWFFFKYLSIGAWHYLSLKGRRDKTYELICQRIFYIYIFFYIVLKHARPGSSVTYELCCSHVWVIGL